MNTNDPAHKLRQELKSAGYNSRQVSVRHNHYSMGSSITVDIKSPSVHYATVKAIAQKYESVRTCSITGDILSGGNTYLHLDISESAYIADAPNIQLVVDDLEPEDNAMEEIAGGYLLGKDPGYGYTIWFHGKRLPGMLEKRDVGKYVALNEFKRKEIA